MGYTERSLNNFSRAFPWGGDAPKWETGVAAMREGRIVHGASLDCFLLFSKKLWSSRRL